MSVTRLTNEALSRGGHDYFAVTGKWPRIYDSDVGVTTVYFSNSTNPIERSHARRIAPDEVRVGQEGFKMTHAQAERLADTIIAKSSITGIKDVCIIPWAEVERRGAVRESVAPRATLHLLDSVLRGGKNGIEYEVRGWYSDANSGTVDTQFVKRVHAKTPAEAVRAVMAAYCEEFSDLEVEVDQFGLATFPEEDAYPDVLFDTACVGRWEELSVRPVTQESGTLRLLDEATASDAKRLPGGGLEYHGQKFQGFNKPKRAPAGSDKKAVVLAKKGDKIKVVRFGQRGYQDYTQHHDSARRKNYLTRSAGIRDGSGKLTKDDKFSANYWARRELW